MEYMSRDNACLLAACALLTGSLWPAYRRIRALTSQRNILNEYVNGLEGLGRMARNLSDMLNNELDDESSPQSQIRKPMLKDGRHIILVFRSAVVAVIAANRLRYFGHVSHKIFVSAACPGEIGGLAVVVAGGTKSFEDNFSGKHSDYNRRFLL